MALNTTCRGLLNKGVKYLQTGLNLEEEGNMKSAIMAYMEGIPLLIQAAKTDPLPSRIQDLLMAKGKLYLKRVEAIRNHLEKGDAVPPPIFVNKEETSFQNLDESSREMIKIYRQLPEYSPTLNNFHGLPQSKEFLEENIILPLKFPGYFDNPRRIRRGVLFFGLPGTGKTHLLRAIESSISCSFLHFSMSDFLSKYVDPETHTQRLKDAFEWTRKNYPCILVLDDLDVLCEPNSLKDPNSIASLIKSELVNQLQNPSPQQPVILAAAQKPWYLTGTLRRRFDRRIFCTLPDAKDRTRIFAQNLAGAKHTLTEEELQSVGLKTENFTGANIICLARQCVMASLQALQVATHFVKVSVSKNVDGQHVSQDMLTPCSPDEPEAIKINLEFLNIERVLEPAVVFQDVERALSKASASCLEEERKRMDKWAEEFGQDE